MIFWAGELTWKEDAGGAGALADITDLWRGNGAVVTKRAAAAAAFIFLQKTAKGARLMKYRIFLRESRFRQFAKNYLRIEKFMRR